MHLTLEIICSVMVIAVTHGEVQPVIEGSVQKPDGTLQILGGEGQPLTVTCLSDHNPIYLMYNDTQYNNSVLFNGSYSVNFTIQATRDDDGENVSCHLVNSTSGEKIIVFASIYLKLKPTGTYIGGIDTYEEGDTIQITCNSIRSRPAATFPVVTERLSQVNKSEIRTIVSYDNSSDTYNTTASFIRTADSLYNGMFILCITSVDSIYYQPITTSSNRVIVHYGPYEDNVYLFGLDTGNEGSTLTFKCKSGDVNPAPTFLWYNDTDPVVMTTNPVITEYQGAGTHYDAYQEWPIVLNRNHIGTKITCVVKGTGNRSVAVTKNISDVYYKPVVEIRGAPLVDPVTGYFTYDEGDNVNLTCNLIESNPVTTVSWNHQSGSGSSSELFIIGDVKSWYNDRSYKCDAYNRVGSASLTITLNVQYGPHIEYGYRRTYEEGDNVTVLCDVQSNPSAKVWWQKKENNSFYLDGNQLILINVTRENGGDYLCFASSNRTRQNGIVELVTANKTFPIDVQYGPGNSIRLSPNITTLVTSHGSTFPVIECIADCNPPCSYFWTRMGSGANLTLGTVNRWHHTGEHTCQASNRVGSTRYETNITFVMYVKYQPYIEVVDLNNYNWYEEGAEVKAMCSIESYPEPNITWSRNDGVVIPAGTFTINTTVNCIYDCKVDSTMTIHHAECLESGSYYTCSADNGVTGPVSKKSLNRMLVKCNPRPANMSVYNYSLKLGDTINLTATFISIPGPAVQWLFRPKPTSGNSSLEIDDSDRSWKNIFFTAVYTIDSIRYYDFGQYFAVADNFNGIQSTITFNVKQNREGFPEKAHNLAVVCSKSSAVITWISAYNGGYRQNFTVYWGWLSPPRVRGQTVSDPGENMTVAVTMELMETDVTYFFSVEAVNQIGFTSSNEVVSCTTARTGFGTQTQTASKGGVIAGAIIGSLLFVAILGIIGFILFRRYQSKKGNSKFGDLHVKFNNRN